MSLIIFLYPLKKNVPSRYPTKIIQISLSRLTNPLPISCNSLKLDTFCKVMKVNKLKVFEDREVEALSQQWIEYVDIYMKTFSPHHDAVLNELNLALGCQSFFGGTVMAKADETVFAKLHEIMAKMSFQEKEKLINLSRWYNTVQSVNNSTALLKFSRTPLY